MSHVGICHVADAVQEHGQKGGRSEGKYCFSNETALFHDRHDEDDKPGRVAAAYVGGFDVV